MTTSTRPSWPRPRPTPGLTVSVCLPARNEEATVGHIVATVRRTLMEEVPLVDEVLVRRRRVDGLHRRGRVLGGRAGRRRRRTCCPRPGRARARATRCGSRSTRPTGDILCWLDADIRNFGEHFVTGLLGPLLTQPDIAFVKGFYRRPLHGQPEGGGRVTELMARPLISTLFPQLARFVQPLSGEYAGPARRARDAAVRRRAGAWSSALLVDIVERFGIASTAQVDLGVREHRNRTLAELGPQATAILVTALRRAGLVSDRPGRQELLRFDADFEPEAVAVEVRERPPIVTVPAYRRNHGHELTA